ncbi:MAG: hypothetical protein JW712_03640 [Dehalococcoidales bacterium]|nr:hypothetical protein [Dehalococcoidales bacterium]
MCTKNLSIQEVVYDFLLAKQAEGKSGDTITNLTRSLWWFRRFANCSLVTDITIQRLQELVLYPSVNGGQAKVFNEYF